MCSSMSKQSASILVSRMKSTASSVSPLSAAMHCWVSHTAIPPGHFPILKDDHVCLPPNLSSVFNSLSSSQPFPPTLFVELPFLNTALKGRIKKETKIV